MYLKVSFCPAARIVAPHELLRGCTPRRYIFLQLDVVVNMPHSAFSASLVAVGGGGVVDVT
jgi:hypothetical protein